MTNPFDIILDQLKEIDAKLAAFNQVAPTPQAEIIDTATLCQKLNLSEPTVIRWRKKGKIPFIIIGSSIRYNWPKVIEKLESKK